MKKLAILTSHPIQYQVPIFRYLAKIKDLSVKVFFCWDFGVKETVDNQFNVKFKWDIPLLDGYKYEFLPNISKQPGTHHYKGLLNPTATERIVEYRPDIVMVHGYNHWTENQVVRKLHHMDIPLMFRGESNLLQSRSFFKRIIKRIYLNWLFKKFDGFLYIGLLNKEYYRYYNVPERKLFFVPYTVDNDFFISRFPSAKKEAIKWRMELGIPLDKIVFLFCAKMIPKKRPLDLLEAFAKAKIDDSSFLVYAGDGELKAKLENRVNALGLSGCVKFIGFQNQSKMPTVYALGDVFVIPSSIEPWGLAVNEAMCMGLPVIASDQVASAYDLITPVKNGWIFPSGDILELNKTLQEAVANKERLQDMGATAAKRVSSWSIAETANGIQEAMDMICAN